MKLTNADLDRLAALGWKGLALEVERLQHALLTVESKAQGILNECEEG